MIRRAETEDAGADATIDRHAARQKIHSALQLLASGGLLFAADDYRSARLSLHMRRSLLLRL